MIRCRVRSGGNARSRRRTNFRNSWCLCLPWHWPMTLPVSTFNAANNVVVPLRL